MIWCRIPGLLLAVLLFEPHFEGLSFRGYVFLRFAGDCVQVRADLLHFSLADPVCGEDRLRVATVPVRSRLAWRWVCLCKTAHLFFGMAFESVGCGFYETEPNSWCVCSRLRFGARISGRGLRNRAKFVTWPRLSLHEPSQNLRITGLPWGLPHIGLFSNPF